MHTKEVKEQIHSLNRTNKFFGEATISASIRNMRKDHCRRAYKLPRYGEIVSKRRKHNSRGYEYKFDIKET